MKNVNVAVLSADDDDSQNGNQIDSNQLISASFHVYFGDTDAEGTVKIQASNDLNDYGYMPQTFTVQNWVDIPNATASITAGASGLITLPQISYRWMRAVFTSTTPGDTTITVNMFAVSI